MISKLAISDCLDIRANTGTTFSPVLVHIELGAPKFMCALFSTLYVCAVAGVNCCMTGARAVGRTYRLFSGGNFTDYLDRRLVLGVFAWIRAIFAENTNSRTIVPQWRHYST